MNAFYDALTDTERLELWGSRLDFWARELEVVEAKYAVVIHKVDGKGLDSVEIARLSYECMLLQDKIEEISGHVKEARSHVDAIGLEIIRVTDVDAYLRCVADTVNMEKIDASS